MANDYYTADKAHILRAKKGSMTAWRNADAVLTSAEVVATNELIAGRLLEPIGSVSPLATGASYLPKFKTTSYNYGTWEELCYFQTDFDLYPAMGVCTTADDTPAATYYTHTHTIRTSQTPTNQARHIERENTTAAESERIDLLGLLLNQLHIECSQASPEAIQQARFFVAKTLSSGTSDIAAASLSDNSYKWKDFSFTCTYGGENLEAEVVGWALDIRNSCHMTGLDTNGFYSIGKYIPLTFITVTLEIIPYGHNAFELIRTNLGSYATDVDLTVAAVQTTDKKQVTFTHDKLYCQPFIISTEKRTDFYEKYLLVLSQMDTGSLSIEGINTYDDDYYET